jgi:hypothetical protein
MFKSQIRDIYCGLRGFKKSSVERLGQRCTGMEFATEMIIKAQLHNLEIVEIPVTLYRDGRKAHAPHLKTFRDGWRTVRFFLLCSPRWLFLVPGAALMFLGTVGYALAMPGYRVFGATLDAHTLLVASLALLTGHQAVSFALFAKVFSIREQLLPPDPRIDRFFHRYNLEKGLLLGIVGIGVGLVLLLEAVNVWRLTHFGPLDYAQTMRLVVPGVTACSLGFQTILFSFIISIIGMGRK